MSPLIFDPSFSLLKKKEEEQADDGGKRSVVKFEDELDDEDDVVRKANEMFIEEMTPQVEPVLALVQQEIFMRYLARTFVKITTGVCCFAGGYQRINS